jgi:hypothetical protein
MLTVGVECHSQQFHCQAGCDGSSSSSSSSSILVFAASLQLLIDIET